MKSVFNTDKTSEATSQGVVAGNTIFISGQIGNDPISGKLISSDIEGETKQLMENIKLILNVAKIDFSHVVKTSIYLADINKLDSVNLIYGSYFATDYPACEIIEATTLPQNANVEISMIAAVNK